MIIQNIDGNKTNFDAFNVKLDRISGKFNVIRLAETNVGIEESSEYYLKGYTRKYSKGSRCCNKPYKQIQRMC